MMAYPSSPHHHSQQHPLDNHFSTLDISIPHHSPHTVVVTLNRPNKRNAISAIMWREIGEVFSILGRQGDDCRVVVLTGAGGAAFTAGIDLSDPDLLPKQGKDNDRNNPHTNNYDLARTQIAFASQIRDMQACFTAVEDCPVPVIAAIQGSCIGAGVDLASACDIRLCSPNTTFSVREVKIGLAADVGTLQRFPKVTGNDSRVREICYTGEVFGAEDALKIGFVSRITDSLMVDAIILSKEIASNSPVAVIGTKRSLLYSRDHSVADGLEHIATHNSLALVTEDIPTAFLATKQRNTPSFANMAPFSKL
jgi:delta(3,5)-delta(2,4)-dienoyl-CoA isomerase